MYFPAIAYIAFTIVTKEQDTGIDWTQCLIAGLIAIISGAIGKQIKNKGDVE